jgi:prepilin-type N-terminal cleavage/methylation domain-containing protein
MTTPSRGLRRNRLVPGARHGDRQGGFTLLELLITLAITTIGMVGVMSLHLSVGRGNDGAARTNEAMTVATETLEWLRSMTMTEIEAELAVTPVMGTPLTVVLPDVPGRAAMTFRRRTIITVLSGSNTAGNDTRLTRFRVEVGWTDDGAVRTAADNFADGFYDHSVAFELIRTAKEFL